MSLLVTGSIGIDTVKTPYGLSEDCLGGSAIYFSMAASYFAPVRFIGVVGSDNPFDLAKVFAGRNVDLTGLEVRKDSKTFRWSGSYLGTMDNAITDKVELNVLAEAGPKVPDSYKDSKLVFLANTAPALQSQLLDQIDKPAFVAADTMNLWIRESRSDLEKLLEKIDALIINEDEARMLASNNNLIEAGEKILAMGPEVVIMKKGESGSVLCKASGEKFILPAFPATQIKDPTGAGDSFAGGFMGYLASLKKDIDFASLKEAVAYGTVTASFTISDFSLHGLNSIKKSEIDDRLKTLKELTQF